LLEKDQVAVTLCESQGGGRHRRQDLLVSESGRDAFETSPETSLGVQDQVAIALYLLPWKATVLMVWGVFLQQPSCIMHVLAVA
jgi:hypothetical protein